MGRGRQEQGVVAVISPRSKTELSEPESELEGAACRHCFGSGHDWEPGPTGEAVSLGPCPVCGGSGIQAPEEAVAVEDPNSPF